MHDLGNASLIVEAEALLGAAGEQMQVAPNGPEEALGAIEPFELGGGQQAGADQIGRTLDTVDVFADPIEGMEIAQASLPVFDVRFHDVATVAHLQVPVV